MILEVTKVSKQFKGITALNEVSFEARKGLVTSIIGPNGAGKTTMINVISGVYRISHGEISIRGRLIAHLSPHKISRLGVSRTFQNLQVFHNMSVLENVMVGYHNLTSSGFVGGMFQTLKARREQTAAAKMARQALEFVGLYGREDESASVLPYGSQKSLELARAIVSEPYLLLLDEPVAGLSPSESDNIGDIIGKLRSKGTTIILIEHDMDFVMQLSDFIVVLNYGEKIASGAPEAILRDQKVIEAYLGS
jgi:branched-chain amino acid transport system ATP-binding protein